MMLFGERRPMDEGIPFFGSPMLGEGGHAHEMKIPTCLCVCGDCLCVCVRVQFAESNMF